MPKEDIVKCIETIENNMLMMQFKDRWDNNDFRWYSDKAEELAELKAMLAQA